MTTFWTSRRVLLTGGGGFLGGFIRERLERERPAAILDRKSTRLNSSHK
jgi:nucleoside-diphosphate-sugar epimerase